MRTKFHVLVFCIIASFCVSSCTPSQQQLREHDYGPYPSNYKQIVANYMSHRLKDPGSAQYTWLTEPRQGYFGRTIGYIVCANLNAKNSFGGYVGPQLFAFIIDKGVVVGSYESLMSQAICGKAAGH